MYVVVFDIVKGDRRYLLPIGTYQGIRILGATEFLAILHAK